MGEAANLAIVKSTFESLGKGDTKAFLEVLDPAVEWKAPGPPEILPFAGVWRGPKGVSEWWEKLRAAEETVAFEPKDFIPHQDKVIVTGSSTMRVVATGRQSDADWVHIYTLKNGRIVAFEEFYDTALEVQAHQEGPAGGVQPEARSFRP